MKPDQFKELVSKLDKVSEDVTSIKISTAVLKEQTKANTDSLDQHMKRSDALEKHVAIIEKQVDQRLDKVEIPTKVLAYIGVPLGVLAVVLEILNYLHVI